ncbi:MAG: hypothetical protein OQL11_11155 [Gammaproteobacteria bacterium]|nr:hypothetical protein [Gammaproteobacteria bacterium]
MTKGIERNQHIPLVIDAPYRRPELTKTDNLFKHVVKDPRYLNDWGSNVLKIDVAEDNAGQPEVVCYNLHAIWLPSNAPLGPFTKPVNITEFPHWIDLLKLGINDALHRHKSSRRDRVSQRITHLSRFMAWCVVNGVYEFGTLTKEDFEEYAVGLARDGLYRMLNVEDRLLSLSLKAKNNPAIAKYLIEEHQKGVPSIRIGRLNELTGLLFSRNIVPGYFHNSMAEIAGSIPIKGQEVNKYPMGASYQLLKTHLSPLNWLYALPDGTDKPTCIPYNKVNQLAESLSKGKMSIRTKNLSLQDVVKLLNTGLSFVYEYSPIIIRTAEAARNFCNKNPTKQQNVRNQECVKAIYADLAKRIAAPFPSISGITQRGKKLKDDPEYIQNPSLMELIQTLQTACMVIIGINHGRRKQEILGERSLPYGIYRGCVIEENSGIECRKIDLYVEKTLKDWSTFLCNRLVSDCVNVLEKINDCFYLSDEERPNYQFGDGVSRREKLFRFRSITPDSLASDRAWCSYDYFNHSDLFMRLSGVDHQSVDHKTHVFRRIFAMIYYHRYDNPQLISLKHHLRHISVLMTRVYVTDPAVREQAESVEMLYQQEHNDFDTEFNGIGKEYLTEKIQDILSEHPTGGGFSKTVFRLYKHLLRRAEFRKMDESDQAKTISNELEDKGYLPSVDMHGVCTLSPSSKQKKASCYSDKHGVACVESACLKTCMNCPFHFDNTNYLAVLKEEASELSDKANDFSISAAERVAYEDSQKELVALIEMEERIQAENSEAIAYAKMSAYLAWGVHDMIKVSIKDEQTASVAIAKESSA